MKKQIRCAIYTRKSTEEGLEQDFNSLDAQREACEAYISSQRGSGWTVIRRHYNDGGISGGTMDRPALKMLLTDIEKGKVDLVVVYKVDRLTRSLTDFSRIIETFDARGISFVSVTQQFNTASSMGRLTLNVLLSFAQFEREVTAERIRDKIAASKKKGMWMGGLPPLGYDAVDKQLAVNETEAEIVRSLFSLYLKLQSVRKLKEATDRLGLRTKQRVQGGKETGGKSFSRGHLYHLLHNPLYIGQVAHKGKTYPGQHKAIVDPDVWAKAQQLLADQAPSREAKENRASNCLLTGLVFDETGDALSPTYTRKGKRRYSYYVSNRLTLSGRKSTEGWRLPAPHLEDVILGAIRNFLGDPVGWIRLLPAGEQTTEGYERGQDLVTGLLNDLISNDMASVREAIRNSLHRITVRPGEITITFGKSVLDPDRNRTTPTPGHELHVPFHTRRKGVETRLVFGGKRESVTNRDQKLISTVGRAFEWWNLLQEEEGWSVQKIAERDRIDASDVTRLLPLAFLAPDIVEAILEGQQPVDLNLEKIKNMGTLPSCWKKQRKALGFQSRTF